MTSLLFGETVYLASAMFVYDAAAVSSEPITSNSNQMYCSFGAPKMEVDQKPILIARVPP